MSFSHPIVLFLLPLPAILLVWIWRREAARVVLPFDHAVRRRGNWLRFPINLMESLPALLLATVIIILAGPQRLSEPRTKRAMTNIEFCIDVSGSMNASFGEGTRYDASMAAIDEFLDYREGDAFGLTFFGNSVLHWVPLTSDASALRCSPPFMRPTMIPPWFGGTEIGKALMACRDVLRSREEGDRLIILISDGYSSDLGNGNDDKIIKELNESDITVYGVHVGGGNVPDPIVNITALSGGEVFEPGDPDALAIVFRHIDEMEEARLEKTAAEALDHFFPYCLAGLSLAGLGLVGLFGLRYTPW